MNNGYYVDVKEIGKRIKKRREEKEINMTLDQLADRTQLGGKAVLSKYENGHTPRLTVDALLRIADALDCEPDYLVGRIKYPKRTTSEIAEKITLSREAIESLENLAWSIREYSDFDALLISCIISDLIIYFVNELSLSAVFDGERFTFKEGLFDDIAHILYAYESTFPRVDDNNEDRQKYAKFVVRANQASIGERLSKCVTETIKKIAQDHKETEV